MKAHLTIKTTPCTWKQMDRRTDEAIALPPVLYNVVGNYARWQLVI